MAPKNSESAKPIAAPQPRPAIERMTPYRPPTANRYGVERLDFNENTVGCSPRVVERLREIATADFLATYPEYGEAREKLSRFFGVGADQVLLSDGTDEAIHVLVNAYVDPGDEVVIPEPSFPMYRFYVEVADGRPVSARYREPDLAFPLEEVLAAIGERTKAVLVANPNNPTGGAIGIEEIERILQKASGAAVLIDEAYFEFYGVTAIGLIERYPNLFVSRTFSKAYGLAGLRVGAILSRASNIAALRKGQSPYSVNSLGVAAVLAAIEDPDYVRDYADEAVASRESLRRALGEMGVGCYRSEANFLLARFGDVAGRVCAVLRAKGMLVRDRSSEIPGAVRITVGTREQTGRLIEALREALGK